MTIMTEDVYNKLIANITRDPFELTLASAFYRATDRHECDGRDMMARFKKPANGAAIKKLFQGNGFTFRSLAVFIGCSRGTIEAWAKLPKGDEATMIFITLEQLFLERQSARVD